MIIRRRAVVLAPGLRRYLEHGDFRAVETLELYALAGVVMRGNLEPLRDLWTQHGEAILRDWTGRGRPWALEQLEGKEI